MCVCVWRHSCENKNLCVHVHVCRWPKVTVIYIYTHTLTTDYNIHPRKKSHYIFWKRANVLFILFSPDLCLFDSLYRYTPERTYHKHISGSFKFVLTALHYHINLYTHLKCIPMTIWGCPFGGVDYLVFTCQESYHRHVLVAAFRSCLSSAN